MFIKFGIFSSYNLNFAKNKDFFRVLKELVFIFLNSRATQIVDKTEISWYVVSPYKIQMNFQERNPPVNKISISHTFALICKRFLFWKNKWRNYAISGASLYWLYLLHLLHNTQKHLFKDEQYINYKMYATYLQQFNLLNVNMVALNPSSAHVHLLIQST